MLRRVFAGELSCAPSHMASYDLAKNLLTRACPTATFHSQPEVDWTGEYTLPAAIIEYFAQLGPVDVWVRGYGNPYFLPSLSNLWAHQSGYRTHGYTHERLLDWDDDWLVIADEGADPFIFSRTSEVILHDFHGEGVWQPTPLCENLLEMVTILAIIGDIVASAGRNLTDDNSIILPRHRAAAWIRIGESLGSRERAEKVLSTLGWN
jgi:hypothetical protein